MSSRLANLKPNQVQVLLEKYMHVWIGLKKTGKTTLFRDLVYKKYQDMSKGLLIAFEKGYDALDGVIPQDIEDWDDFEDVVSDLIDNKDELPYKLLCLDTIDEMIYMAEQAAIKFFNKKSEKKANTLNEAGGGFNRGKDYTKTIIRTTINNLRKAGYGIVCIGHSKDKKRKEKDGTEYNQLTCSLTDDYTDIFMDMADLIVFMTNENEINNKSITSTTVYMNFRNEGAIDCGGRFKNLPDKIEWGAENYLNVFEKAVKSSMLKPIDDIAKLEKEQQKVFDDNAKKNIEKMNRIPLDTMITYIKSNFTTLDDNKKASAKKIVVENNWKGFDDLAENDYDEVLKMYDIMRA
jgi:hypothetical protein